MKKTFYVVMSILFIVFICIFSSSTSGYYEYSNNKKNTFTEEKMKEFEKDVEEGKNVNIKDYIEDNSKDYSNKITRLGDNISNLVYNSANFVLKGGFKMIEKMLN